MPCVRCHVLSVCLTKGHVVRPGSQDKGFVLELMKTDSYDAVAVALAQHLQLPDPSFVQFTQQSSFTKAPKVRGIRLA